MWFDITTRARPTREVRPSPNLGTSSSSGFQTKRVRLTRPPPNPVTSPHLPHLLEPGESRLGMV